MSRNTSTALGKDTNMEDSFTVLIHKVLYMYWKLWQQQIIKQLIYLIEFRKFVKC